MLRVRRDFLHFVIVVFVVLFVVLAFSHGLTLIGLLATRRRLGFAVVSLPLGCRIFLLLLALFPTFEVGLEWSDELVEFHVLHRGYHVLAVDRFPVGLGCDLVRARCCIEDKDGGCLGDGL